MNQMNKIKSIIVVAILTIVSSLFGADDDLPCKPGKMLQGHNIEQHLAELRNTLELTDEQYQLLLAHKRKSRKAMGEIRTEFRQKKSEIINEIQQNTLNMNKINLLHIEAKALKIKMLDYRLEKMLNVRKILSPNQFKRMHEFMKEKRRNRREKQ